MKLIKGKFLLIFLLMIFASGFITGCDSNPENTDAVVSDGITDNDLNSGKREILPNVTAYKIIDKNGSFFAKYLLSENVEGLGVVFCIREYGSKEWIRQDILESRFMYGL